MPTDTQGPQLHISDLKMEATLRVSCTATATEVWSQMRCPQGMKAGTDCSIHKERASIRRVLCHDRVMILTVPRLACHAHKTAAGRATTFNVTGDPQTWAHVERMQQDGKVVVQPEVVVFSSTVALTMKAYR